MLDPRSMMKSWTKHNNDWPEVDYHGGLSGFVSTWLWRKKRPQKDVPPCVGYLSLSEFRSLNCGLYHDCEHALEVAELTKELALALGSGEERAEFLRQVAFLHDADPRIDQETGEARPGTPARVQVTLDWMEQERARLLIQFGWYEEQFDEALALIARTDFPFDSEARTYGTRFDGLSPIEVYTRLLGRLSSDRQEKVLRDGLLLRFADQAAPYVGDFRRAAKSVHDLTQELNQNGCEVCVEKMLERTPEFLEAVGEDLSVDQKLKATLGLNGAHLHTREELLKALPWHKRYNFRWNQRRFKK